MSPSPPQTFHPGKGFIVACVLLSLASFFLGVAGLWPQFGPALVSGLYLIICGPVIAYGSRAPVEIIGWRALSVMAAIACGLILSSFFNANTGGFLQSPQRIGEGAPGGFMLLAALEIRGFLLIVRQYAPRFTEGLNSQIALSAAAAVGAFGVIGPLALIPFIAVVLIVCRRFQARGRTVDITGLFAACSLGLLSILTVLPYVMG